MGNKKKHPKKKQNLFLEALRSLYSKDTAICVLLDIALLVVILLIVLLGVGRASQSIQEFTTLAPKLLDIKMSVESSSGTLEASRQELHEVKDRLDSIIKDALLISLLIFLLIMLATAFFKGPLWSRIKRQKFSLKFFTSFLWLNLVWFLFWLVLFFLTAKIFRIPFNIYLILIEFVLMHYLTALLYPCFDAKSMKQTFASLFHAAFRKGLLVYLVILLTLVVLLNLAAFSAALSFYPGLPIIFLAILIALHWSRLCFNKVIS
jgi:hypothetical protein